MNIFTVFLFVFIVCDPFVDNPIQNVSNLWTEYYKFVVPQDTFGSTSNTRIEYEVLFDDLTFLNSSEKSLLEIGRIGYSCRAEDSSLKGDILFVACETDGVLVLNVSDSNNPFLVTQVFLEGDVVDLLVDGDFMYIARGDGTDDFYFPVYNISNLNDIHEVPDTADTYRKSKILRKYGDYLFAHESSYLYIYEVSTNPFHIAYLSSIPTTAIGCCDIAITETHVFATFEGAGHKLSVYTWDAGNLLSECKLLLQSASDVLSVAVQDGVLIVGVEIVDDEYQILKYDISTDPCNPILQGETIGLVDKANRIALNGDTGYVANDDEGILIFEVSSFKFLGNLSGFDLLGLFDLDYSGSSDDCEDVQVNDDGDLAYLSCRKEGLIIINVTNTSNPTVASTFQTHGDFEHIFKSGSFIYATRTHQQELFIFDISDKYNPQIASVVVLGDYTLYDDIRTSCYVVDDQYAFVTTIEGFVVLDVTDKYDVPSPLFSRDDLSVTNSVEVVDGIMYLASSNVTIGQTIYTFDVSEPENPELLDFLQDSDSLFSALKYYSNDGGITSYLFSCISYLGDGFLNVYNVTNSSEILFLTSYDILGNECFSVDINPFEQLIFVGVDVLSILVIDISDISSLEVVGRFEGSEIQDPYSISVVGQYVHVADSNDHWYILNGSWTDTDVYNLSISEIYYGDDSHNSYRSIVAEENYVYVAGEQGLQLFKLNQVTLEGIPDPDMVSMTFRVDVEGSDDSGLKASSIFYYYVANPSQCVDQECTTYVCEDGLQFDDENSCSKKGNCSKEDGFRCVCKKDYNGTICNHTICISKYNYDPDVCGGSRKGSCNFETRICDCERGYFGEECEIESECSGVKGYEDDVCGGHGDCNWDAGNSECDCDDGFVIIDGSCGEEVELEAGSNVAGIVVGSVFGGLFTIGFLCLIPCCIICYCLFCCLCCCCAICILLVGGTGSSGAAIFGWKLRPKKYNLDKFGEVMETELDRRSARVSINEKLFEINYDDLDVVKSIGTGGSGSIVFLCRWNGIKVAFKCFQTVDLFAEQQDFDSFEKEVAIMSSIRHPHCLTFYGSCLHPPRVGIVMEFCPNGELKEYIEEHDLESKERFRILRESCDGMRYLHDRKVIHRDIKSENILLTEELHAKIIDFGLSKIVDNLNLKKTKLVGTSFYMAPEVVLGENYSQKCDMFSFAIVMWEVICVDFNPYKKKDAFNIEYKVANNPDFRPDLKSIPKKAFERDDLYKEFCEILKLCWSHKPESRPGFDQLIGILKKFEPSEESSDDGDEVVDNRW